MSISSAPLFRALEECISRDNTSRLWREHVRILLEL
jgi:hypothetical protein